MATTNSKFDRHYFSRQHSWVSVINPLNHRMLLQACDDCGVVKSENSVVVKCKANKGMRVISNAISIGEKIAV